MLQEMPARTEERSYTLVDQARALAVVLRDEFGVPFALYDARDGNLVLDLDPESQQPTGTDLSPGAVVAAAAEGLARVSRLKSGRWQLLLMLYSSRMPALVAVAEAPGPASPAAEARELRMWQGWLQAVSDRLRLADQLSTRRRAEEAQKAQATVAWEGLLALDQAARGLRIHKEAAPNHRQILEAAWGIVQAQSLIWIPARTDLPPVSHGDLTLTIDELRQLVATLAKTADLRAAAPVFCNDVATTSWGGRFPGLDNLVAFPVVDRQPRGWLIALNKKGGGPFRRSDAALLLPFVALFDLFGRWSQRFQELKDLLVGLARSLTTALDAKDSYTFGHSERVARIAVELGKELGLTGDELGDIYLAGLLHDVGKIGIKDTVLNKQGSLTPEEQEHIQQHVTIGYWILAELTPIRDLLPGVLYHHERYDGTGYPEGLAGENIPLLARILAVADAYDAMSHQRPYRDSMPYRKVEEILRQGAGTQWDPKVVDAFFNCRQRVHAVRQRGVGDSFRLAIDGALRSHTGTTPVGTLRLPRAQIMPNEERNP